MKRSTKFTHTVSFKDPITRRRRHAKMTRSHVVERNFASGGAVSSDLDPYSSAAPKKAKKRAYGGRSVGRHSGSLTAKRLDKAARGIQKRQLGGPVGRPALPAQAAPQAAAAAPANPAAAQPAGGAPSWAGTSLPPQASPQANAFGLLGTAPPQGGPAAGGMLPAQANPSAPAYGLLGTAPPGGPAATAGARPAWAGFGRPGWAGGIGYPGQAGQAAMGVRPFKGGGRVR
jgi:hypothetical protein